MVGRVGPWSWASRIACGAGTTALFGCVPAEPPERIAKSEAAIIGGRPSGDDENATVVVALDEGGVVTPRCTGRIVAPTLAITARHCVVRTVPGTACGADGTPLDVATAGDLTLAPVESISVQIGSDRSALRNVGVRQVLTTTALSICKADIAFVVLSEAALGVRAPIRREPVRLGETFSVTGWGRTSDDSSALPPRRSTLDAVRVKDVGPGLIPVGSFATGGKTLCFGDSGASALIDGAVVGVYSRIGGNCDAESSTSIFSGLSTELDLVERAFAAIGEKPLYAGDDAPATEDAGAPAGDSGAPVVDIAPDAEAGGCAMGRPPRGRGAGALLALAALLGACRRRRRAS